MCLPVCSKRQKQGGVLCHILQSDMVCNGPWELIHSLRSAWTMLRLLPRDSLFWLRVTLGMLSWADLWAPAQPWADAQALQATGWAPEYYLFIDLPMVFCRWWQAFGQLSNLAYSCNLPIRKEKRIICHRYSLGFVLFCFVSCCWLFLWLPNLSNTRPVPPVLFGYLWHYLLGKTINSASVRTYQEWKEIFKLLCSFHKSAIIAHDEIWQEKSYSTNIKEENEKELQQASLTKLHDFSFSTGVEENFMGFFFSTAMVVIWILELFADQ